MIYFVRAKGTDFVKIGHAKNVGARIFMLQAGNHLPLLLIREEEGGRPQETWAHNYFASRRIEREWFHFCDEMLTVSLGSLTKYKITPPFQAPDHSKLEAAIELFGGVEQMSRLMGPFVSTTRIESWRNKTNFNGHIARSITKAAHKYDLPISPDFWKAA